MKLYTEEQVRQSFFEGIKYAAIIAPASMGEQDKYVQNTIDSLTPIELPSDEEMANASNHCKDGQVKVGFLRGVLWMKEQILNQNK